MSDIPAVASSLAPSLALDNDRLALDYEEISATRQFQSGKRLCADLAIAAGERVLDVGCGTGLLAEHIANLVGPAGFVLGLDPLPLRIELAHRRVRANLAFEVGDAYALDHLASGSFDVVVLNAVFHWLPEKAGPLSAFARVLRAGGRIGIGTGVKGHRTRLQEEVTRVLAEPPFDGHPRRRESISWRVDTAEMAALFDAAGLAVDRLEVRENEQRFPTPDAAVRYTEASSFGNFLGHLPEALKPLARARVAARLSAIMGPDGLVQEGRRLVALGVKR